LCPLRNSPAFDRTPFTKQNGTNRQRAPLQAGTTSRMARRVQTGTNTERGSRDEEWGGPAESDLEAGRALLGTTVLIVEDEAILALDLALTVGDEGGAVEGPLHRLDDALALTDLEVDAAILDVDLGGKEVFAFADRLREKRVPIVFHTGRSDLAHLANAYPEAGIVKKPCSTTQIVRALTQAITRALTLPTRAGS
jgi:CheY-like chemotaxis protein